MLDSPDKPFCKLERMSHYRKLTDCRVDLFRGSRARASQMFSWFIRGVSRLRGFFLLLLRFLHGRDSSRPPFLEPVVYQVVLTAPAVDWFRFRFLPPVRIPF